MTQLGIVYAQLERRLVQAASSARMLLLAVLTNQLVRRYAEQSRK